MAHSLWHGIGKVLFWRYRRGSWQYDILCFLIIVFIFLTPRSLFDSSAHSERTETAGSSGPQVELESEDSTPVKTASSQSR